MAYKILDNRDVDQIYSPASSNPQSGKAVASAIANIVGQFESGGLIREIVDTLPEIAAANESTIYMVANNDDVNENVYDEYMFINGNWEIIGSTVVDLTSKPGEKTEDGGEIFNDYTANDAVGFGASASGRNSKAGSRAFKILNIKKNAVVFTSLAPEDYSYSASLPDGVYKGTVTVCDEFLDTSAGRLRLTFTVNLDSGSSVIITFPNGFAMPDSIRDVGTKVAFEVCDDKVVKFAILQEETTSETESYDITVRGNVSVGGEHNEPYAVGNLLQIECKGHLNNSYKIAKIAVSGDNSIITAEKVDERIISAPVLETNDPDNEENWLYVAGKNGAEISPQLTAAFVAGDGSIATGWASAAFGRDNIASGNYSTAIGRQNVAGYCGFSGGRRSESGEQALAFGSSAKALGIASVATGSGTFARAHASRAGGLGSKALFERSVADGYYVDATAMDQHAVGRYNRHNSDAMFIVGNGTADDARSNAMEVLTDGNILIKNATETVATTADIATSKNELIELLKTKPGTVLLDEEGKIVDKSAVKLNDTSSNATASASYSLAVNQRNKATGVSSMATGVYTHATGQYSFTAGIGTVSRQHGQFVVGSYNDQTAWEADNSIDGTNRIFIVGNGTNADNKSNAFEVRKDGTAWLQTQGQLDNSVVIKDTLNKELATKQDKILVVSELPDINTVPDGTICFVRAE